MAKGKGEKGKAGGVKGKKKAKGKGKGKGKAVVAGAAGAVSKLISLRDSRRGNSMLRGPSIDFHMCWSRMDSKDFVEVDFVRFS